METRDPEWFTDDTDDPCAYCVWWDEMGVPRGPDGSPVRQLYRGIHVICGAAVAEYASERGY